MPTHVLVLYLKGKAEAAEMQFTCPLINSEILYSGWADLIGS